MIVAALCPAHGVRWSIDGDYLDGLATTIYPSAYCDALIGPEFGVDSSGLVSGLRQRKCGLPLEAHEVQAGGALYEQAMARPRYYTRSTQRV